MIKDTLQNIGGVGLYGIISICLFFAVFTGMLIWVLLLKKNYVKEMSELPLQDDPDAEHSPDKTSESNSTNNSQTESNHE
jgi:cytochrome c oxidase cbb3-type subunit 4